MAQAPLPLVRGPAPPGPPTQGQRARSHEGSVLSAVLAPSLGRPPCSATSLQGPVWPGRLQAPVPAVGPGLWRGPAAPAYRSRESGRREPQESKGFSHPSLQGREGRPRPLEGGGGQLHRGGRPDTARTLPSLLLCKNRPWLPLQLSFTIRCKAWASAGRDHSPRETCWKT